MLAVGRVESVFSERETRTVRAGWETSSETNCWHLHRNSQFQLCRGIRSAMALGDSGVRAANSRGKFAYEELSREVRHLTGQDFENSKEHRRTV